MTPTAVTEPGTERGGALEFPSIELFGAVRDAVNADADFRRATQWFDGSVLIQIGEFSVWMKWYKGQIIDLHEGPDMLGSTFTLSAPQETWQQVLDLPRKSWRPWAGLFNSGAIATSGHLIEATRVLEAQFVVVAHLHAIVTGSDL